MRTKTLIIAAAALAAGMLTSSAQTYSQNIVGYVNQTIQPGYNMYVIPFSVTSSNNAEQIFPSLQGGDTIAAWDPVGQGYIFYIYAGPASWFDGITGNPVNAPLLPCATGIFYNNGQGVLETNTYTGTVVLSQSTSLLNGYNMVGSAPPIAVADIEDANMNLPLQGGDTVATWDPIGQGFVFYIYAGPGSWFDGITGNPVSAPSVSVGEGIFYNNGQGVTESWTQTVTVP